MRSHYIFSRIPAVAFSLLLACALAPPASAQADGDLAEVSRYRLLESGLAKYAQATRTLASIDPRASDACDEADDEEEDAKTIDATAARLDANPQAARALESAGMSSREFVVFSFALLQSGLAAWALEQPGGNLPPGVSMENVEFVRKHKAELDALAKLDRPKACGEDEDEAAPDDAA